MGKHSKLLMILTLAWTLSGCGSSGDDDDPNAVPDWCLIQYSTDTEWVSEVTSLVLEPSSNMYVTPQEVDLFYQEVRACAAQTYPEIAAVIGPSVRYENFKEQGWTTGYLGFYTIFEGATVFLNTDDPIGRRSCYSDKYALKHEFLHHLIWQGSLPLSLTPEGYPNVHGSKLFALEADGGCVPEFIDASLAQTH